MRSPVLQFAVLMTMLTLASSLSYGQAVRSGSDTTRVMQQLQQLTSERAQLQVENTSLKQQVEDLKEQLAGAKSEHSALQQRAKALQASTAAQRHAADQEQTAALEKTRVQLQELVGKFRETAQSLRDVETDRAQIRALLAQREREHKVCVDRNVDLYDLNGDILAKLEDRGFWSSFASVEPFTRIARTRLENLIEDYRYRADELKLERADQTARTAVKDADTAR